MKYIKKTNTTANAPISHTNDQLTYAYIDAQNLHQSSKHWGWKLDYTKFREYLRVEFNVTIAYLFMGYIQENQDIYSNLQKQGYILVFRETSEVEEHIKGNCDVELVMQAMLDYNEYQQAVVVTGDGDFTPLIRHLNNNGKLKNLLIPNRESYSKWLNKTAKGKMTYINLLKSTLYAPMHIGDTEESNHPTQNTHPRQNQLRSPQSSSTPIRETPTNPIQFNQESNEPVQPKTQESNIRPRTFRNNNRNQPSVIKFYNSQTSQEIKAGAQVETKEPVLEVSIEPKLETKPAIESQVTEPAPKKVTRGRTPRAKKTDPIADEITPDLSKPIKDVSIFL